MRYICVFFLFLSFNIHGQSVDTIHQNHFDEQGRKQGLWLEKIVIPEYKDSLNCSVNYVDGILSGKCRCTDPQNNLIVNGTFLNGKRNLYWGFIEKDKLESIDFIYMNGELIRKSYYTRSHTDSSFTLYKENYINKRGNVYQTQYYKNNQMTKTRNRIARSPSALDRANKSLNLRGPWTLNAGYVYQQTHWLELGVKKYSHLEDHDAFDIIQGVSYVLAGAEINFNTHTQVAPKIGFGHYFTSSLLNFNLSGILYNDQFEELYPAITPEIGFSTPVGIVQINYGYTIFFEKNAFTKNITHRLSIHINIPFTSTGK